MTQADERTEKVRDKAFAALSAFYAHIIRNEIREDPDHSGPEDAAGELAEKMIEKGYQKLFAGDWRGLLS